MMLSLFGFLNRCSLLRMVCMFSVWCGDDIFVWFCMCIVLS